MPDKVYQGLPFEEAIAYFRGKVKISTRRWNDLWQGMHARGFMAAGAIQDDVLTGFYEAIDTAISKGTTLADFQKDFDNIVKKTGWTYNGTRGWRSKLIYETNLFTAYQAGRHAQMTDKDVLKARPYWMYRHGDSRNPRPQHLAWDGLVLRADDPWWQSHYPPCGWGCKCTAFALSDDDLKGLGKTGPDDAPEMRPYQWTDKKTGQTYTVADKGIDPGWDYNVGEAAHGRNQALRLMDDTGPWKDLGGFGPDQYGRPERIPVEATSTALGPKAATVQALRQALRTAIGGDTSHLTDPTGAVTEVGQAIVDHILKDPAKRWNGREQYFTLIPDLITDPYEIWVTFARSELSGRVALRRKYVKALQIKGGHTVGMVAEEQDGYWAGLTFFHGDLRYATTLRKGHMIYGKN